VAEVERIRKQGDDGHDEEKSRYNAAIGAYGNPLQPYLPPLREFCGGVNRSMMNKMPAASAKGTSRQAINISTSNRVTGHRFDLAKPTGRLPAY
jgi:hypothetical protein